MVDCSIIILTYNSAPDITDTLDAAKDQRTTLSYEFVVADNNSSDRTVEIIRKAYPDVEVIEHQENWGSSKGYNKALKHADGDYVVYLNPDTTVHRDWLQNLYSGLRESDADAAMSSVFEPGDEGYAPDERTGSKDLMKVKDVATTGYVYNGEHEMVDHPVRTLHLAGNSMMFDASVFDELSHAFEEAFFLFADDIDIALRLNVLGKRVIMVPDAIVYHHQRARADPIMSVWLAKKHIWALSGRLLSFYKNMYLSEYLLALPLLIAGGILNARALKGEPAKQTLYAVGGIFLTGLCFLLLLARFRDVRSHRNEILAKRCRGRFWLLRKMVGSTPPRLDWSITAK